MTMNAPGLVKTDYGFKPFEKYREIRRGRRKGQIELEIRVSSVPKDASWSIKAKKIIVYKSQILRFPGVEC